MTFSPVQIHFWSSHPLLCKVCHLKHSGWVGQKFYQSERRTKDEGPKQAVFEDVTWKENTTNTTCGTEMLYFPQALIQSFTKCSILFPFPCFTANPCTCFCQLSTHKCTRWINYCLLVLSCKNLVSYQIQGHPGPTERHTLSKWWRSGVRKLQMERLNYWWGVSGTAGTLLL